MLTNVEIQKSIKNLIEHGQSNDEIIENLHTLIMDWHHPNEAKHLKIIWKYRTLRDLLIKLFSLKLNNIEISEEIQDNLFSFHPTEGIDSYINSLHDITLNCLERDELTDIQKESHTIFKTYKSLRQFLKELKIIEAEQNKERSLLHTN